MKRKRREDDSESRLREFFQEAYWLQHGEYRPETHESNVETLCREYPWERHIIDALYRLLPHFDFTVDKAGKRVLAGELTRAQAYDEVDLPIFYYIPYELKGDVWQRYFAER